MLQRQPGDPARWLRSAVKPGSSKPSRVGAFVQSLIAAGEDPYIISRRLGPASIRTTYDVYGHLFEGRD